MSDFREMRRKRQQLSEEESIGILQKATAGILALLGDKGYPCHQELRQGFVLCYRQG